MDKKTVSKKTPIILASVWLVVAMGVLWYTMPKIRRLDGLFAEWNVQMLVFLAEMLFSVAMMTAIRVVSVKAQVKWLAIVSKILLIFYSVIGGLGLIAFIVVHLIGI